MTGKLKLERHTRNIARANMGILIVMTVFIKLWFRFSIGRTGVAI